MSYPANTQSDEADEIASLELEEESRELDLSGNVLSDRYGDDLATEEVRKLNAKIFEKSYLFIKI